MLAVICRRDNNICHTLSAIRRSNSTKHTFPGFDNVYATTTEGRGSPIPRTGSPLRNRSPYRSRSMSPGRVECADIDPEAVRVALRDFVSQLASAERERVC